MSAIRLQVTIVSRKTSAINRTVRMTWENGKCTGNEQSYGAEWETVEFRNFEDLEPSITVANVQGGAVFLGDGINLMINDPTLFGTFKAGDVIELHKVENPDTRKHCPKCGSVSHLHYDGSKCLGCDYCYAS